MAVTVIATPGDPTANSYETVVEFQNYLATRLNVPSTIDSGDTDALGIALITATRVMNSVTSGRKQLVTPTGRAPYYRVDPSWTGLVASATQALAWPRSGMFDQYGTEIGHSTIPQGVKDCLSELAIALMVSDRTANLDAVDQGLKSMGVGSIRLEFKDDFKLQVLPNAALACLLPGWLNPEQYQPAMQALFDVASYGGSTFGGLL